MAAPNFEAGKLGERGIEATRMIERVLKESNCIDLESLCVIANEKVWQITVDVHVVDHDGSIIDCASIAVICALKSFRRPDVTISGEHFIVHSPEEREPVPLNMFHMPICMTFGLTENGSCITVDPCEREQNSMEGEIVVAMNSHKEVCAIHCTGKSVLKKIQVLRCVSMAAQRCREVSNLIKETFEADTIERPYKFMFGSFKPEILVETVPKSEPMEAQDSTENSTQPDVKWSKLEQRRVKKKIAHLGNASPSLITQRSEEDEDEKKMIVDDAKIIDEILNVRISEKKLKFEQTNDDDDLQIMAVKKNPRNDRKQRTKRKDDGVEQLLLDLEQDDPLVHSNNTDDDLQIVGQFVKKNRLKR